MTVLDTFRFEAHSPPMNKSAVIIATIVASFTFAGVAHANGDHEPECGYDQVCHESTAPTTTIVATDEPPAPTTVAPPTTIGAVFGPADAPFDICPPTAQCLIPDPTIVPTFTCLGTMVADVCVPTTTTVVTPAAVPLPATGRASERIAGLGLILMALGGLVLGVRWVFKRT